MRRAFSRIAVGISAVVRDGWEATVRQGPVLWVTLCGAALVTGIFFATTIATNTTAATSADWRKQAGLMIWAAMLSALAIAFILYLIIQQVKRQHHETQQRFKSDWLRLGVALDNMSQGLKLYDASGRLIACNRSYIEMFDLSPDIVKPGAHFREVMQHRQDMKTFDGDVDQFCSTVMQDIAEGRITKKVMEFSDGRAIRVINTPLAQGGWITTMEDVTERRDLEHERDRNYTFLREIIDHIPWQITVKDAHTRKYLLANREAEEQLGEPHETIIGKTVFDILPKPVAESITHDDDQLLRSPDGLFLDAHAWHTGNRYITSRRIGIQDETGEPRYIINVVEDVTERRRASEKIAHMAHYDALTDLPNRVLFREQIERELEKVDHGKKFALLYIDVDEFKSINDSLGHHVGDELLKAIANRIRDCLKQDDLIARLGGDEFAVIRTGIEDSTDVQAFVTLIHEEIRRPYHCLGHHLSTDASIGIALAPQDGANLDQLLKNADLAMYAAKADERRIHRFFEPAMHAKAKARLAMEQDLRRAMIDGGFELHYQPIVDLRTNEVSSCEALLRWQHPEHGMMLSSEFIPVAEDTGLIVELGDWALRTACMEAATWPAHVRLAVNVSPVQLNCETFALKIAGALTVSGLDPRRLELEITEAILIHDDETALSILHQLRSLGVRISLDDFGTGYSSLSYVKRFPFDKIKIDRSFVVDVAEASGSQVIVQAVVNIASVSNMTTVAEGVETEAQRAMLRALGCTEMQGYLFSGPKPATEVKKLFGMGVQGAA